MSDLSVEVKTEHKIEALKLGLERIQQRGFTVRTPVPYVHKDDYNFNYFIGDIKSRLGNQEYTGKLRLGVVVGAGALLSILPEVDTDAWIVLDNNKFVLDWSDLTVSSLKTEADTLAYISRVYRSPLALEAQKANIIPNLWLEIEKNALKSYHFLNSEPKYNQVKENLFKTQVLFCLGDLSSKEYMEELSRVITENEGEIAYANLTDILEFAPLVAETIDKLPFRQDAVISWATRNYATINHPSSRLSTGILEYKQKAAIENNLFRQQWHQRLGR